MHTLFTAKQMIKLTVSFKYSKKTRKTKTNKKIISVD